jgi:uncharacterized protein (TIGR03435 family)
MKRNPLATATILALTVLTAFTAAQSLPARGFEVASIKPNHSDAPATSRFPLGAGDAFMPGGVFAATNQPLNAYLRFAFPGVPLEGLPSWVSVERFDIEARAAGSPSKDEMRRMMEKLLADRFALVVRRERRSARGLALRLAKKGQLGPALRHTDPDACPAIPSPDVIPCGRIGPSTASAPGRLRFSGRSITLARLATFLTNPATGIDGPVFDQTALSGPFDLDLEWTAEADATSDLTRVGAGDVTFSQALRDQLGLTLVGASGSVEVLQIVRINRPTVD